MEIKDLIQQGFWVLLVRSLGAGIMLIMTILFARWLGAEEFGLFSLGMIIMTFMSVFSRWGTGQILLKQVGAHWEIEPEIAKGYIVSSIQLIAIISLILAILISSLSEEIATYIFNKPKLSEVLFWFGFMIIFFSINQTIAEAYKGIGRSVLSAYLQNVITPFIAILLGIILYYTEQINLINITQSFSIGVIIALISSAFLWIKIFKKIKKKSVSCIRILKEGWTMLIIASSGLVMASSDMFVIGMFGTAEELGIYSAVSRTVLMTSLILVAMNSITAPKYAKLYKNMDLKGIEKLSQNSSSILLSLIIIPTAILLIFPEWILGWYGSEFTTGVTMLMVLTIGQALNVACGSVGYILSMSGKERIMQRIVFTTAVINIILSLILVQNFGAFGVALATTISVIIWNVWSVIEVKKHLGFWAISLDVLLTSLRVKVNDKA